VGFIIAQRGDLFSNPSFGAFPFMSGDSAISYFIIPPVQSESHAPKPVAHATLITHYFTSSLERKEGRARIKSLGSNEHPLFFQYKAKGVEINPTLSVKFSYL